ncbi:MAG: FmdB family zinc ribbon protein [bacterium]
MPIYEFLCEDCKSEFETLCFGSESVRCPMCQGENVVKLISTFTFSGSGVEMAGGCQGCSSSNCASCPR